MGSSRNSLDKSKTVNWLNRCETRLSDEKDKGKLHGYDINFYNGYIAALREVRTVILEGNLDIKEVVKSDDELTKEEYLKRYPNSDKGVEFFKGTVVDLNNVAKDMAKNRNNSDK